MPPYPSVNALAPPAWRLTALLALAGFLNYVDRVLLITMRSALKADIPMSDAQFGLLTTVFLVVYAVLSPLAGFLADRFSRRAVIIGSLALWSAVTCLTATARSFEELLLWRALLGVSEAAYLPAAAALLMGLHPERNRSLANSLHLSGVILGSALGGLGGWIAERHDWRAVLAGFGVAGLAHAAILLGLLREGPREGPVVAAAPRPVATLVSLFRRPGFGLALLLWGGLAIASWSLIGWLPAHFQESFALAPGVAGLLATGCNQGASLFGMVAGGFWADRWSRHHPRGRILVGVAGLLVAIPGMLLAANAGNLGLAVAGLILFGFARPFPDASMVPLLCQLVERSHLATAVGFLNCFATLVAGLTIYLGGVLRDAQVGVTVVFNTGAAGLALCALLLWLVRPPDRAAEPPPPRA